MSSEVCSICYDDFFYAGANKNKNKEEQISKNHVQRQCYTCQALFGQSCLFKYLTDITTNPHCPFCEKVYTKRDLYYMFPKKYVNNDIQNTRVHEYVKRERNALQTTMPYAKIIIDAEKEYDQAILDMQAFQESMKNHIINDQNILNTIKEYDNKIVDAVSKSKRLAHVQGGIYTFPCPINNCRGFINGETFTCGLCHTVVCQYCFEATSEEHECDNNVIKNVNEMIESTKPCPNCNTRIYKTYGCNHMFCTVCEKGFHWETLKEIHRGFQNPHYQRTQQNQETTRDGDTDERTALTYASLCDILYILRHRSEQNRIEPWVKTIISNCWNETFSSPIAEDDINTIVNTNLLKNRIDYLAGNISEQNFEETIRTQILESEFVLEQSRLLRYFEQQVIDMTINTILELGNQDSKFDVFESFQTAIHDTCVYVNNLMNQIYQQVVSNRKIPQISYESGILTHNVRSIKPKKAIYEKKLTVDYTKLFPYHHILNDSAYGYFSVSLRDELNQLYKLKHIVDNMP